MKTKTLARLVLTGAGLITLGWSSWTSPSLAVEPIRPDDFAKLHALMRPRASEEKWSEVPWLTSLWEARKRAAAEGKPILLWEMDGHPLGCT